MEELLDVRDFQNVAHPLTDPNQAQTAFRILPSHIGTHKRPNPGGIGIRDLRKIEDEILTLIGAHRALKQEDVRQNQRTGKGQNTLSRLASRLI